MADPEPITFKYDYQEPEDIESKVPGHQKLRESVEASELAVAKSTLAEGDTVESPEDYVLSPVMKVTNTEVTLTNGEFKMAKVVLTEDVSAMKDDVLTSKTVGEPEIYSQVFQNQPIRMAEANEGNEKKKTRIPKLRFTKAINRMKKEREDAIAMEAVQPQPQPQPRRSSIPRLVTKTTPEKPIQVEEEKTTDEDEFDKIYDHLVDSPVDVDVSILNNTVEDPKKVDNTFEEIVHAYEKHPGDVAKHSKIPRRKSVEVKPTDATSVEAKQKPISFKQKVRRVLEQQRKPPEPKPGQKGVLKKPNSKGHVENKKGGKPAPKSEIQHGIIVCDKRPREPAAENVPIKEIGSDLKSADQQSYIESPIFEAATLPKDFTPAIFTEEEAHDIWEKTKDSILKTENTNDQTTLENTTHISYVIEPQPVTVIDDKPLVEETATAVKVIDHADETKVIHHEVIPCEYAEETFNNREENLVETIPDTLILREQDSTKKDFIDEPTTVNIVSEGVLEEQVVKILDSQEKISEEFQENNVTDNVLENDNPISQEAVAPTAVTAHENVISNNLEEKPSTVHFVEESSINPAPISVINNETNTVPPKLEEEPTTTRIVHNEVETDSPGLDTEINEENTVVESEDKSSAVNIVDKFEPEKAAVTLILDEQTASYDKTDQNDSIVNITDSDNTPSYSIHEIEGENEKFKTVHGTSNVVLAKTEPIKIIEGTKFETGSDFDVIDYISVAVQEQTVNIVDSAENVPTSEMINNEGVSVEEIAPIALVSDQQSSHCEEESPGVEVVENNIIVVNTVDTNQEEVVNIIEDRVPDQQEIRVEELSPVTLISEKPASSSDFNDSASEVTVVNNDLTVLEVEQPISVVIEDQSVNVIETDEVSHNIKVVDNNTSIPLPVEEYDSLSLEKPADIEAISPVLNIKENEVTILEPMETVPVVFEDHSGNLIKTDELSPIIKTEVSVVEAVDVKNDKTAVQVVEAEEVSAVENPSFADTTEENSPIINLVDNEITALEPEETIPISVVEQPINSVKVEEVSPIVEAVDVEDEKTAIKVVEAEAVSIVENPSLADTAEEKSPVISIVDNGIAVLDEPHPITVIEQPIDFVKVEEVSPIVESVNIEDDKTAVKVVDTEVESIVENSSLADNTEEKSPIINIADNEITVLEPEESLPITVVNQPNNFVKVEEVSPIVEAVNIQDDKTAVQVVEAEAASIVENSSLAATTEEKSPVISIVDNEITTLKPDESLPITVVEQPIDFVKVEEVSPIVESVNIEDDKTAVKVVETEVVSIVENPSLADNTEEKSPIINIVDNEITVLEPEESLPITVVNQPNNFVKVEEVSPIVEAVNVQDDKTALQVVEVEAVSIVENTSLADTAAEESPVISIVDNEITTLKPDESIPITVVEQPIDFVKVEEVSPIVEAVDVENDKTAVQVVEAEVVSIVENPSLTDTTEEKSPAISIVDNEITVLEPAETLPITVVEQSIDLVKVEEVSHIVEAINVKDEKTAVQVVEAEEVSIVENSSLTHITEEKSPIISIVDNGMVVLDEPHPITIEEQSIPFHPSVVNVVDSENSALETEPVAVEDAPTVLVEPEETFVLVETVDNQVEDKKPNEVTVDEQDFEQAITVICNRVPVQNSADEGKPKFEPATDTPAANMIDDKIPLESSDQQNTHLAETANPNEANEDTASINEDKVSDINFVDVAKPIDDVYTMQIQKHMKNLVPNYSNESHDSDWVLVPDVAYENAKFNDDNESTTDDKTSEEEKVFEYINVTTDKKPSEEEKLVECINVQETPICEEKIRVLDSDDDIPVLKGKVSRLISRLNSRDELEKAKKQEVDIPKTKSVMSKISMFEQKSESKPSPKYNLQKKPPNYNVEDDSHNFKPKVVNGVLKTDAPKTSTPPANYKRDKYIKTAVAPTTKKELNDAVIKAKTAVTTVNAPKTAYFEPINPIDFTRKEPKTNLNANDVKVDPERDFNEEDITNDCVERSWSIDNRIRRLTSIEASSNLKKAKSLADLELNDSVKGKVHEIIYRINSREHLNIGKGEALYEKERPIKKSVSQKIAMFEGKMSETTAQSTTNSPKSQPQADPSSLPAEDNLEAMRAALMTTHTKRANMTYVILSNGVEMPVIAIGTANINKQLTADVVAAAIALGYRAIDSAYIYGNEKEVGEGIKRKIDDGTVTRRDLFIISKLWSTFHQPDLAVEACKNSLEAMGLDYFDQYLIHNPMSFKEGAGPLPKIANVLQYSQNDYLDAWYGLERLATDGWARSIGVSNFNASQLQRVIDKARIKPVVNQVECHPYLSQARLEAFCSERNVTLTCYGVLGSKGTPANLKAFNAPVIDDPLVKVLAAGLGIATSQLLIKFQLQQNRTVIVKAATGDHLYENLNSLDVTVSDREIDALNALNRNKRAFNFAGMGDTHKNYPFRAPF